MFIGGLGSSAGVLACRVVIRGEGVSAGGWVRVEWFLTVGPYVQVWLVQRNVPAVVIFCTSLSEKGRNSPLSLRLVHRNATRGAERCTYETCTPARGMGEQDKLVGGKREKGTKGRRFPKETPKKYGILLKKLGV